jgi:hypothetical protein
MAMADLAPTEIALVVFQEIVGILATNLQTTPKFTPTSNPIVNRAKELVKWNDRATITIDL